MEIKDCSDFAPSILSLSRRCQFSLQATITLADPAGLQVVDPTTGLILADYDTEVTALALEQDRLYLYRQTEEGNWTEILDAPKLEPILPRLDQSIRPAHLLNGNPILLADTYVPNKTRLTIFDPASLTAGQSWEVEGYQRWITGH